MNHFFTLPRKDVACNDHPRRDVACNVRAALQQFLARILQESLVNAVLVPARSEASPVVMQTLVKDPNDLCHADPLAPVAWTNGGTLLSTITHNSTGTPIAAVLRSCEVRAFVERVKLNQGSRDGVLLVSADCLGRFENSDYLSLANRLGSVSDAFLDHSAWGAPFHGLSIARACQACEQPIASCVDIQVCLLGQDTGADVVLCGVSEAGRRVLSSLGLSRAEEPPSRQSAVARLISKRKQYRDELFAAHRAETGSIEGLVRATAACINCYNCRVACPVCYCRSCVFTTDLYRHDCANYLAWANQRGSLRVPTDTLMYHLTRMVHISTMCVGCGQCSSACPNGVPVMELFCSTGSVTQARFGYVPGRSFDEPQPMATFHEDELHDVAGHKV